MGITHEATLWYGTDAVIDWLATEDNADQLQGLGVEVVQLGEGHELALATYQTGVDWGHSPLIINAQHLSVPSFQRQDNLVKAAKLCGVELTYSDLQWRLASVYC